MYGRKSKYVRRYARKGRSKIARMAKGKTTSVQALAKAVRRLQRHNKSQPEYLNYVQGATQANISSPFHVINLCDYTSMTPMFGSDANDDDQNKVIHKSFGIDGYISLENLINNEEDSITITQFLVSLRDHIGPAFNTSTGALSLTNQIHYYSQDGLVMLNKKCFRIHKVIRRVLSNHGTSLSNPSAQNQYGTDYRFYMKWSPNSSIQNPTGDWKALSCALDPSKQYYLLTFNNNSVADLESPAFTYNVVHTMKTVA